MRLTRRIADALRSPARLAGLLRRVGQLAAGGELRATLRRLRPRSFSADDYREWLAAHAVSSPCAPGPLRFAILLDATQPADELAIRRAFADAADASLLLVRTPQGTWLREGQEIASLAAALEGSEWLLWVTEPLALAPGALAVLACGCALPGARIVYADHDVADEHGVVRPAFKSAWDPWQLCERDYVGPLLAVHRSLAAGVEAGHDGDSWRLLLDAATSLPDEAVVHVPALIAHTHAQPAPARELRRRAIAPALLAAARRRGLAIAADPQATPWIRYLDEAASVTVVVPTRDRPELLERCLASVIATRGTRAVGVVVVDNGSIDPTVGAVCDRARSSIALDVVRDDGPFNFPRLCNTGVAAARGRVVVLLNNDTIVEEGWLDELAALAVQPGVGVVGPLLLYPGGRLQSAGVLVGVNRTATSALAAFDADDPAAADWCASRRRVSAVLGACMAIERTTYVDAGGLDERFGVSHNEVDLGLRLEARGLANLFTPFARVVHDEGATRGFEVTAAERERLRAEERLFAERWGARLARCDPAYHPSLARQGTPFALGEGPIDVSPRAGWDGRSR